MAKELLVGKNGNKKTTDFYTWLNGLKYRVIEGYTWKNGLCYQFYGAGSPSVVANFWFFYKTVDRDVLITEINPQGSAEHLWRKFANGITFYALLHSAGSTDDDVLVISTDADGLQCGRSLPISDTGTVTYNNTTWYWGFCNSYVVHDAYYIYPIDCRLPDYPTLQTMRTQGIQHVLAKIYADDFAEDYQVGNTYNLVKADIEKTIRKFIAMYLFLNVDMKQSYNYPTAYGLILSHIEDVVTYILQNKGNNDIVDMIADYSSDGTGLAFLAYYSNDTLTNVGIESYTSNFDGYGTYETDKYVAYNSYSWIQFKGDGTISYSTTSIQSSEMLFIGRAGYGTDYLELSNVGLLYQRKIIRSILYSNANVSDAGVMSIMNGNRSPVEKVNNGDAVVFCVRNGQGTGYGGNWMVTVAIALSDEAAELTAPNTGNNDKVNYTINGVTYYAYWKGSNSRYGWATEISSPIGLPIFDDWNVVSANFVMSIEQMKDIIQTLDIRVQ